MTLTAQPVDYTDPQTLLQWRESLMAFELRAICADESASITRDTRYGTVRDRLREKIEDKTLTAATMCFADLHSAIFGERRGDRMMVLVRHFAAVATTLANNTLVSARPGTVAHEVEQRHALLYETGILLEDVLVEIEALNEDELPLDVVIGLRYYLHARNGFTEIDAITLEPLLICQTDYEFLGALNSLTTDFRKRRGMWGMLDRIKGRPVLAA